MRVDIHPAAASSEEAAAIAAALQQFMRATTPLDGAVPAPVSAWLRAGLLEGTGRQPDASSPWGDPHPWGA